MKLAHNYIYKPSEKHQIILGCLTYASAKLFNIGNYERLNWSKDSGEDYPNWYKQKKELKTNFWYNNLPSQTAQETLKILSKAWESFYKLIEKYKQGEFEDKPNPPYYKPKNSKYNVRYLNNGFKLIENNFRLSLPKQLKSYLQEKYSIDDNYIWLEIPKFLPITKNTTVKQIEFKPLKDNTYKVSIIIDIPDVEPIEDNFKYLSIDLGISNLMTCYDNYNEKSFIVSGKQWLSINRYFDKTISYYQSISNAQQNRSDEKPANTKRIKDLYCKRKRKLNHLLHSATKIIVNYCIDNNISKVIVGDLKNIRKDTNFGNKTNQKMHKLPFAKTYKLLEYKLAKYGISISKQKEHYTSQCSPNAKKVTKKYAKKSNRKCRGLYVDKDYNYAYNADSVGAFNIMRKHIEKNLSIGNLSNPKTYKWIDNKFKIV